MRIISRTKELLRRSEFADQRADEYYCLDCRTIQRRVGNDCPDCEGTLVERNHRQPQPL